MSENMTPVRHGHGTVKLSVRVPAATADKIAELGAARGHVSQSETARQLILAGLATSGPVQS